MGQDVKKSKPSYTDGGNVKQCSHFKKQCGSYTGYTTVLQSFQRKKKFHSQEKGKDTSIQKPGHKCLQGYYSQLSKGGNNSNAYQLING